MAPPKLPSLIGIEQARSAFQKIVTTTPVVLTVIATILAGLSSSESNLAQYNRSLSAQNQSKAADQWALYQAKRTRQEEADNTRALLAVMAGSSIAGPDAVQRLMKLADTFPATSTNSAGTFDTAKFLRAVQTAANETDSAGTPASYYLAAGLPAVKDQPLGQSGVESAMKLIEDGQDASSIIKTLNTQQIEQAIAQAQLNANNFDAATKPITSFIDRISALASEAAAAPAPPTASGPQAGEAKSLAADLTASRLSWNARRNTAEAKYNQTIAEILEVQVQYSSLDSDRHRDRSKFFFYGMLAAQAGVTISTLSLAVQKRSLLWAAASLVGMGAVAYAAYIYLFT
jgi:hypothetical protein